MHQLRFHIKRMKKPPIFVFTMGKVASTSVQMSLRQQYKGPVAAGHVFTLDHERLNVRLLYRYYRRNGRPIKIISLVREPIGRNISAFFQNFERDTGVVYDQQSFSIDQLKQIFLYRYYHDISLNWFDEKMNKHFGIDVYSKSFPEVGYQYYENEGVQLLVLRSDLSDQVKEQTIQEFLKMKSFKLHNANIGSTKEYASTYVFILAKRLKKLFIVGPKILQLQ